MSSSYERFPDSLFRGDLDPGIEIPEHDTELRQLDRECPLRSIRDDADLQQIRAMLRRIVSRAYTDRRSLFDAEQRYINLAAVLITIYKRSSPEIRLR